MKLLPNKFISLSICDPPYGIKVTKMTLGNGKKKINRGSLGWDNKIPSPQYFNELFRVSKNQIIWGANYMTKNLPSSMGWVYWDKGTGMNDFSDGELAYTSFNRALRSIKISWVGANAKDKDGRFHPTQKPVALYAWLLKNYAKKGDLILDTHLGSGSSRIAAYKLGFDFVGYEIDKDYYKDAEKRFQKEINGIIETNKVKHIQQSLFKY
jgi:site-specific DNA-methyltransferase (adenine-specific)